MGYEQAEIEALVRKVIARTMGNSGKDAGADPVNRRIIVDAEAVRLMPTGSVQNIADNSLITPLAREIALERHIRLQMTDRDKSAGYNKTAEYGKAPLVNFGNQTDPVVAVGADHGGYEMKEVLKGMLETSGNGYAVIDCGTHSTDAVDYPDYAFAVARQVAEGNAWRGIIIDGAGIGSCMVANKVPGVRAALCYDQATAVNSREHNNANVLTLGAGLIGLNLAKQLVQTWLKTEFGGGRHARRVAKIDLIGERFAK